MFRLEKKISSFVEPGTDAERPLKLGEVVQNSQPVIVQEEDEEPDLLGQDAEQPAGWNVTSMQIDEEQQAAIKIQSLRRGNSARGSFSS